MGFYENYTKICDELKKTAIACGRNPESIRVLAVSKTRPVEDIREALSSGIIEFGENRVQEAINKMEELPDNLEFHLIGHLQSNKAVQAAGRFSLIHSVDSVKLAKKLDKACSDKKTIQRILIQANTASEESKSGITSYSELHKLADFCLQSDYLKLEGLMTIGAYTVDRKKISESFKICREWKEKLEQDFSGLELKELSMGMSGDYDLAIAEGSTILRIGTALFGERNYS